MLPSIANLLGGNSAALYYHYPTERDHVVTSSPGSPEFVNSSSSTAAMHHLLHEGFIWESRSSSSPSPSSPCSDYSSSPSSPSTTFSSTAVATKTSLSFILNDDTSDLDASSFGQLLPQHGTSTERLIERAQRQPSSSTATGATNNKRKRTATSSDCAQRKERRAKREAAKKRSDVRSDATTTAEDKKALTDEQRAALEAMFELDPLPGASAKMQLAEQLGVPLKSVQLWFQNHRSKLRKREKKRIAREEAARRAALSKPRFVFHNMKAQAQANGFLQQFVVDVHH